MSKPGYDFEVAVCDFVKTLDPSAEVLFDHKVIDRDTGSVRQCDVWINAKFGDHIPFSILVSCKDHSRKLDIGDIGTFINEVRSTGASTGVIYSRCGFSKNAVTKAKTNGIACCKLYQNEPPDLPSSVWFDHFVCYLSMNIKLASNIDNNEFSTWNDLFHIISSENEETLLDYLSKSFLEAGDNIVRQLKEIKSVEDRRLPQNWANEIEIQLDNVGRIKIHLFGMWKLYRARTEASLLNGSYSLMDDTFRGEMHSPYIDMQGSSPGDHWDLIAAKDFVLPQNAILMILFPPANVKEQFQNGFGLRRLTS